MKAKFLHNFLKKYIFSPTEANKQEKVKKKIKNVSVKMSERKNEPRLGRLRLSQYGREESVWGHPGGLVALICDNETSEVSNL